MARAWMLAVSTIGLCAMLPGQEPKIPTFMGRQVTVQNPAQEDDGVPKGPASVCVDLAPEKQCYTAPTQYGNNPTVAVIQIDRTSEALLFSAESGGVSGWSIHFALLRPGPRRALDNMLWGDPTVSNQSQHAFWNEPAISSSLLFLTASYEWGADEAHYDEHRYVISTYSRQPSGVYGLMDSYLTVGAYDIDSKAGIDILKSEKPEILARLRRVKAAEMQHRQKTAR